MIENVDSESTVLKIGTRGSPLAMAQATMVQTLLAAEGHRAEIVPIKTTGDIILDRTLSEVGGKGLFTKELDEAQFDGRVDLAVHSMKDVPTWLPDGLSLAAILPREDPRDAWLSRDGAGLMELPAGAVVGTASLRRAALILHRRPDLKTQPLRGNVDTRLDKLRAGDVDATLLACAGLNRLGRSDSVPHTPLDPALMLPAVAQGAVGITIRSDDSGTRDAVAALNCVESALRVTAERAMLAVLDGSCHTPIAALAELDGDRLTLSGMVLRTDGSEIRDGVESGAADDAEAIGKALGARIKADLPPGFLAV